MLKSAWRAGLIVATGCAGDCGAARADGCPSNDGLPSPEPWHGFDARE
jgi:hypothetical protein